MKAANIADFKNHLSRYLSLVERGEEIEVRKRNVPIARVVPVLKPKKNQTVLGCGTGSVRIIGDLTEPLIPIENWNMLSKREDEAAP